MAQKRYWPCKVTICDKSDLLSWDDEFMDREKIKDECICENKSNCIRVSELLQAHKYDLAHNLLQNGSTER